MCDPLIMYGLGQCFLKSYNGVFCEGNFGFFFQGDFGCGLFPMVRDDLDRLVEGGNYYCLRLLVWGVGCHRCQYVSIDNLLSLIMN